LNNKNGREINLGRLSVIKQSNLHRIRYNETTFARSLMTPYATASEVLFYFRCKVELETSSHSEHVRNRVNQFEDDLLEKLLIMGPHEVLNGFIYFTDFLSQMHSRILKSVVRIYFGEHVLEFPEGTGTNDRCLTCAHIFSLGSTLFASAYRLPAIWAPAGESLPHIFFQVYVKTICQGH
jgi:hypothetical protein